MNLSSYVATNKKKVPYLHLLQGYSGTANSTHYAMISVNWNITTGKVVITQTIPKCQLPYMSGLLMF